MTDAENAQKQKAIRLAAVVEEVTTLTELMESDEAKNNTPENQEKLTALLIEGETIKKNIDNANRILGLKNFTLTPAGQSPAGGDGVFSEQFTAQKSLGEQFIDSETYKTAIAGGKIESNMRAGVDIKGFLPGMGIKTTFQSCRGRSGFDR
jgi:hypothetical protein